MDAPPKYTLRPRSRFYCPSASITYTGVRCRTSTIVFHSNWWLWIVMTSWKRPSEILSSSSFLPWNVTCLACCLWLPFAHLLAALCLVHYQFWKRRPSQIRQLPACLQLWTPDRPCQRYGRHTWLKTPQTSCPSRLHAALLSLNPSTFAIRHLEQSMCG